MKYTSNTRKIHNQKHNRHTRKKYPTISNNISGRIHSKKAGWITLSVYGEPFQRGYAHGYLLHKELKWVVRVFPFILKKELKVEYNKYLRTCVDMITPIIMNDYPEFYEEIRGISEGAKSKGVDITVDALIAWNSVLSMYSFFRNNKAYKCSAFIATGNATEKGDIIMAHNTHADFISGQLQNIIMYIYPSDGFSFTMQTAAGYIASGIDWFICSSGIIGCETTISETNYKPHFGTPFFVRIRQAMQYGKTIDEYKEIMLKNNAGDYACSWLLGDINTNEIALFEIGLKKHALQRTKNGVFYGMNTAVDLTLRNSETTDKDFLNMEKSSGARNFRLNYLLNEKYYGKLNMNNARTVISDHYDVFLNKKIQNSRTICKHSENDVGKFTGKSHYPFGCTDGKVVNTSLARKLKFIARFGSSCGRKFDASEHIRKYPQYKDWSDYLADFPVYPWITIHT